MLTAAEHLLQFVGPELGPEVWAAEQSTQFIGYFLDGKNHADKKPVRKLCLSVLAGLSTAKLAGALCP